MRDSTTTDAFLDEACKTFPWLSIYLSNFNFDKFSDVMQKFDHPHIIKLIGVCTDQPVLLIMELARLGEVISHKSRSYLIDLVNLVTRISSRKSSRFRFDYISSLL